MTLSTPSGSRSRSLAAFFACLLVALASTLPAAAEQEPPPQLGWVRGPGTAPIGDDLAEIELSEDYVFLGAEDTRRMLEMSGNPTNGTEMATIAPLAQNEGWFLVFEWADIGYVEDEEGADLDAEALLESLREGTRAANEERERRGWSTIEIVGWHETPFYDASTNNLTWAIIGESSEGRSINRLVKLLGRRGVMSATLVASPEELDASIPKVDDLLDGYSFKPGSTYAEFVPGQDRLAEIGLTALIAGGAGAALVKSGLLARFWKLLVAGGAVVVAGISRLFGRKKQDPAAPIG
ncbi:MAG: DUF2167 domain-containing protein [Myxococcota bacterium]|nr:DUF2167 domain-containing protein [Myxococcota bacterium]